MGLAKNEPVYLGPLSLPFVRAHYREADGRLRRGILPYDQLVKLAADIPYLMWGGHIYRTYRLALVFLACLFGPEWNKENVEPTLDGKPTFLRKGFTNQTEMDIYMIRIILLAEMLFNLQKVSGFDSVLDQIKNGMIETGYAELEVGKLLRMAI
jgi:hypothetical protein